MNCLLMRSIIGHLHQCTMGRNLFFLNKKLLQTDQSFRSYSHASDFFDGVKSDCIMERSGPKKQASAGGHYVNPRRLT